MSEWKIPFASVEIDDKEHAAVSNVLTSKWLTMGEVTQQFEQQFAEFLNVKYAFAVSSCTAALHLANVVLGVGAGDEVICPALTFVATANAVRYCGGKVVFADITGDKDLNISQADISRKITSRTKGIILVHYGGYACNMPEIMQIAKKHNLFVIEDTAHAPGASASNVAAGGEAMLGTLGDVGCFSFFSNKNMATGEGGMLVTKRQELADKVRRLRSHGMTALTLERYQGHAHSYDVTALGYNYRLDEIRSAIGIVQLGKLLQHNAARKKLVEHYRRKLERVVGISIPFKKFYGKSAYHLLPILLDQKVKRDDFMNYLKAGGIQTSVHYPALHLFSDFRNTYGFREGHLTKTEAVARMLVTLPLYPSLAFEQVDYVVSKIEDYLKLKGIYS